MNFLKNIFRIKEKTGIDGIYRFSGYEANEETKDLSQKIKNASSFFEAKKFLAEMQEFLMFQEVKHNVVCNGWRENMAFACQETTIPTEKSLNVSHFAVGTGTASPLETDTALGTEVFRAGITSQSASGNTVLNLALIDYSEGNGYTFTEAGIFSGNGDVLSSRVLISPNFSKTVEKIFTFEASHTFISA